MKHRPNTLALLISLIGVGVSSLAQARSELRVVRLPQPALHTGPEIPTTALDRTRWSPGLVWRSEQDAIDPARPWLRRKTAGADEAWAPGEVPDRSSSDGSEDGHALGDPTPTATPIDAEPSGNREQGAYDEVEPRLIAHRTVDTDAVWAPGEVPAPVADEAQRDDRVEAAQAEPAPRQLTSAAPSAHWRHWLRVVENALTKSLDALELPRPSASPALSPEVPPDRLPASGHADQLMERLAAVLQQDLASLNRDLLLSRVAERFPATIDEPPATEPESLPAMAGPRVGLLGSEGRREVVVDSQAGKVLRNLEAVLSSERGDADVDVDADEVRAAPSELIVATQSEKVLATLFEVSSAHRAHEVAAARDASQRSFERSRATAVGAGSAQPATPDASPIHATAPEPVDLDIDLTQPFGAQDAAVVAAPAPWVDDQEADAMQAAQPKAQPFGDQAVAVNDRSLDRVRGGFVAQGLNISFGIERAVYVNGALVTTTSLNVSELGRITAGSGASFLDARTLALVQSGAGNSVSAGSISPSSIGTVIQNTLDGQQIQNVTVINATVNSLGVLRGLNLQSSLRGAVIDSLRR